jgi:hypothetical protein
MVKVPVASEFSLSRRHLLWLTALGSAGWGMKLKAAEAATTPSGVYDQLDGISETVMELQDEDPKPIGFEYALPLVLNAFDKRTPEDSELLAGRLYYETFQRLSGAGSLPEGDFSKDNIRRILSGELPARGFTREYFDGLLADTKTRIGTDVEFRKAIEDSTQRASSARRSCRCTESTPCWFCVALLVLIIVLAVI